MESRAFTFFWTALTCASVVLAQGAHTVLPWREVPGAASYELEIATDAAFKNVVLRKALPRPGFRWQVPPKPHFWRVRSLDAEGRPSEWSPAQNIASAEPPVLETPLAKTPVTCGETLAVAARESKLLRGYVFELAADERFANVLVRKESATGQAELGVERTGPLFLRARGVDLNGRETAWGSPRPLTAALGATRLVDPGKVAWAEPPLVNLSWSATPCAKKYLVETGEKSRGAAKLSTRRTTLPFQPSSPGSHRFRVTAVDEQGRAGPTSPWVAFEVVLAAPTLEAPSVGAELEGKVVENVELSWSAVPGAKAYRVTLSRDPEFKLETLRETVAAPRFRTGALASGTQYWQVVAVGSNELLSEPSARASFEVVVITALASPRLLLPSGKENVPTSPVSFSWSAVPQAVGYDVALARAGETGPPSVSRAQEASAALELSTPGEYVVKVRAVDASGGRSVWSPTQLFYFGVPQVKRFEVPTLSAVTTGSSVEVVVRPLDERGRGVRGGTYAVRATHGSAELVGEQSDGLHLRYTAPPAAPAEGSDVIALEVGGISEAVKVPLLDTSRRLAAGVRLGFAHNLGRLASPYIGGEVALRTPLLRHRLSVSARLGSYFAGGTVPESVGLAQPVSTAVRVFPLSVLAVGDWPLGRIIVHGGLGPSLQLTQVVNAEAAEVGAAPGALVVAGASAHLGPGALSFEAGYALGALDAKLGKVRTGGLQLTLGYAVPLGGGG